MEIADPVHICELTVTETATAAYNDLRVFFCDASYCASIQVEFSFARNYSVIPGDDGCSFSIVVDEKKKFLRVLGVMKTIGWELLSTSAALSSNGDIFRTFYYSRVGMSNIELCQNSSNSSNPTNLALTDEVAAPAPAAFSPQQQKPKPRKSISQRFVSLLTGKTISTSEELQESNSSEFVVGSEVPQSAQDIVSPEVSVAGDISEALGTDDMLEIVENRTLLSMLGDKTVESEIHAEVSPAQTELAPVGSSELIDDLPSNVASSTPSSLSEVGANPVTNGPRVPRKSISQRFGSFLSPSKASQSLPDLAIEATPVEPEKHDNPILQRFKTRSDEELIEEANGPVVSSVAVQPRSRQLLRRLSAAKLNAACIQVETVEKSPVVTGALGSVSNEMDTQDLSVENGSSVSSDCGQAGASVTLPSEIQAPPTIPPPPRDLPSMVVDGNRQEQDHLVGTADVSAMESRVRITDARRRPSHKLFNRLDQDEDFV